MQITLLAGAWMRRQNQQRSTLLILRGEQKSRLLLADDAKGQEGLLHHAARPRALLRSAILAAALAVLSATPLLVNGCTSVVHADAHSRYVDTKALDLVRLLPPPPANDSAETRAELDLMLQIQQERTASEAARAQADNEVNIYRFADVLGDPPAFTPARLPRTHALFRKITGDELAVIGAGKEGFARPRPYVIEPLLTPVVQKPPPMGSYPSGHATWAYTVGLVLADMIPERRTQIFARAAEYGHNRIVAGVHYPSDVESGKVAGTVLAAALFASPVFQVDYAAAKSELRQALNLPAQPH
jgi:acid phosphatase (class A)